MSFVEATLAITVGYVLANIILVSIGEYVTRNERQREAVDMDAIFEESFRKYNEGKKARANKAKKGSK